MGSCCSLAVEDKAEHEDAGKNGVSEWFAKMCERLESVPALLLGGACLLASFLITGHSCADDGTHGVDWWNPAFATVFICGVPVLREAISSIWAERKIRASLLISIAMVGCLSIGQIFAAGEVAFIMALGEMLEAMTLKRAKKGMAKLVSLLPQTARYVVTCPKCLSQGMRYKDVPIEELNVGDGVRILPGETIPVDGVITEGETSVDQSVITGESLPVDKRVGDNVYSGAINQFGAVTVRVGKKGEDSSIQKLVRLVKGAAGRKSRIQRVADRWAEILVPASLAIAALTFLAVWAWQGDVAAGLIRGVTILVVFCPCSLALATPTAIMAAIGQATKYGVIVKSGEALEKMGRVNVACLDKTGTLTTGKLSVRTVEAYGDLFGKDEILRLAASVEASSEHPLAKAIVASTAPSHSTVKDFRMAPGKGVTADVDGRSVVCGTEKWLAENGVSGEMASKDDGMRDSVERLRNDGCAVVLVAVDGKIAGAIALADTLREDSKNTIAELRSEGVSPCLLTGDSEATASAVATALGIGEVHAELLPGEKASMISQIQDGGRSACMVGDGVNDAVALKTADVGIAMGGEGCDIAVEAADIALVGDDIGKLAYLKRLSVACVRLIKLNISISMGINAVAIALSVLGLLTPVTGALVHNAGSLLVVLNAALLYDRNYLHGGKNAAAA